MAKQPTFTVKPKLRFPKFLREAGWDSTSLGSEVTFYKGRGISKSDVDPAGNLQCIRYGELYTRYGEVIQEVVSATNTSGSELFLSRKMDVIVPASGESKEDIARASCVLVDGVALGSDLNIIRSRHNGVFLSYLLNSSLRKEIAKVAQGDTVVHLYPNQLGHIQVALPTRAEQRKIADCLMSLDDVIGGHRKKLDALRLHKRGLMQALFPIDGETYPALRFPEFHEAPEWRQRPAGELFRHRKENGEEGLPIYSVTINDGMIPRSSIDRDFYDIVDPAKNKMARAGDIAYNMMRMWQGALGVASEDCLVSPAYVVLAPLEDACAKFFAYLFKLPQSLQLLTAYSRGLTKDRLRLYFDDFSRMPICVPDREEQTRISECLSAVDAQIIIESERLTILKSHKQGLMQQLFPASMQIGA